MSPHVTDRPPDFTCDRSLSANSLLVGDCGADRGATGIRSSCHHHMRAVRACRWRIESNLTAQTVGPPPSPIASPWRARLAGIPLFFLHLGSRPSPSLRSARPIAIVRVLEREDTREPHHSQDEKRRERAARDTMASTGNLWWTTPLQCLATIGMAANCGTSPTVEPSMKRSESANNHNAQPSNPNGPA